MSKSKDSKLVDKSHKDGSKDVPDSEWRKKLTPQQYRVLREKATDRPSTHEYDELFAEGVYHCAGCDTPLYTSEMKFECGCGWPGFWTNIDRAVREEPDSDGSRVEILCNYCNGHLGHVFRGERFGNPLNERHCVNGSALRFVPGKK
jgi:peptide-methionine (R)-S-oxide reductase